jgi:transcriptional regulator with XRE-family HTH domain
MPHKPEDKEEADALRCALGKRVRAAREARGWSQDALAEEIGVGGVMLGRYERGEKFPSHLTLIRLAQTLRALRRLSDAQREAVVAIVGELAPRPHAKRG